MKKIAAVVFAVFVTSTAFASTVTPPSENECKSANDATLSFASDPAMVSNQQKATEIVRLIQSGRSNGVGECQTMQQVKAASVR